MAPIAILFGLLMTILGGGFYVYTEMGSVTALIPAFFGIALIILGILAMNQKFRMHAMHLAALLGLVGFAMPGFMVIKALASGSAFEPVKHGEQIAMSALSLIFLVMCVKSFIDVRRARKQNEATASNLK